MTEVYERIIDENEFHQIRLTINEFKGIEYLHLRKYYLDFDENWHPSSDGISMPLSIDNAKELFSGLAEILSLAETKEIIETHFKELISEIYQK